MKALFKDASLYTLGDFFFRLIHFSCFPLFAHFLQLADFGTITQMMAVTALCEILFGMGFQHAMHRNFYEEEIDRKELVTTGLVALLACGAGLLGILYVCVDSPLLLLVTSTALLQKVFDYCLDVFRMELSAWRCTLLRGLQRLLSIAASVYFVFLYHDVFSYFWGSATGLALTLPFVLGLLRTRIGWKVSPSLAKSMLRYGFPIAVADLGYWSLSSIDRWMLDGDALGLYGTAFKLATVMIVFCNAFGLAWHPHALRAYAAGDEHRTFFSHTLTKWFYCLILTATTMGLFSPELLHIFTPMPYWNASRILPFLSMGFAFYGSSHIFLSGISIAKKTTYITLAHWCAALINFGLNLIFIPRWGPVGAAFTSFFTYGCLTGYLLLCSQRLHPIPLQQKQLGFGLAMIGVSLTAQLTLDSPLIKILFLLTMGTLLWSYLPSRQSKTALNPLNSTPEVDILMAVRNGEKYLEQQIQSIFAQDYPHLSLTVRENRSEDKTLELLRQHSTQIRVISTNDQVGALGNFSKVAECSTKDYIMFADCDDAWHPHKVSVTMKKMQELEELHGQKTPLLVHTDLTVVNRDLSLIHPSFFSYSKLFPLEGTGGLQKQLVQNTITGNTVMVNRALLQLANPIPDESIMHDWWLGLVAAAFGAVGCIHDSTLLYRQHGHNDTGAKAYSLLQEFLSPIRNRSKTSFNNHLDLQAQAFLNRFKNRLSDKDRQLVENYIRCLRSPPLFRLWYMATNGFYKCGLLRNIKAALGRSVVT